MYGLTSFIGGYVPPVASSNEGMEALAKSHEIIHRLENLELACAGMWDLLKTKHGYTDEDIIEHIHIVDARDGVVDGKMTAVAATCPKCHRQLLTKRKDVCNWCGEKLLPIPF